MTLRPGVIYGPGGAGPRRASAFRPWGCSSAWAGVGAAADLCRQRADAIAVAALRAPDAPPTAWWTMRCRAAPSISCVPRSRGGLRVRPVPTGHGCSARVCWWPITGVRKASCRGVQPMSCARSTGRSAIRMPPQGPGWQPRVDTREGMARTFATSARPGGRRISVAARPGRLAQARRAGRAVAAVPPQRIGIQPVVIRAHRVDGRMAMTHGGSRTHRVAQRPIAQQAQERLRSARRHRPHQQSGVAVADDFRVPATSLATTARPAAQASSSAIDRPSVSEGRANTSTQAAAGTSRRAPAKRTRPVMPSAAAWFEGVTFRPMPAGRRATADMPGQRRDLAEQQRWSSTPPGARRMPPQGIGRSPRVLRARSRLTGHGARKRNAVAHRADPSAGARPSRQVVATCAQAGHARGAPSDSRYSRRRRDFCSRPHRCGRYCRVDARAQPGRDRKRGVVAGHEVVAVDDVGPHASAAPRGVTAGGFEAARLRRRSRARRPLRVPSGAQRCR